MAGPGGGLLGGRYELCSLLATGGMGTVWRGRDTLLDRAVAVKVLRSEHAGDATFLARFRAEAQHTARLAHRNIAALHDYGEQPVPDGTGGILAWLVMELVEGESLATLLARSGRRDVPWTLDLLRQAADGLAAAHDAGVVHRDVKPGNLLVGTDGVVRITDFGVAWSDSDAPPLTLTGQVVGTAQYLSPEQAEGGRAGPASDVYALGVVGFECLAGRRPFDGGSPVQIALRQIREEPGPLPDDVPAPVRALVARALVKDPARRFPDGAAFRDAVDDVLAGRELPPAPHPATTPLPEPLPARRRRPRRARRALAPVAALLAGGVLGIGGLQLLTDTDAAAPPAAAAAAGIVLSPADHLGRPVDEVAAALGALGLRVSRVPQENAATAAGSVTGLDPVGTLSRGDLVTVTYAVAPAAPSAPAPDPAPQQAPVLESVAGTVGTSAGAASGGSGDAGNGSAGGTGKPNAGGNGKPNPGGNGRSDGHGKAGGPGRSNGNGNGHGRNG